MSICFGPTTSKLVKKCKRSKTGEVISQTEVLEKQKQFTLTHTIVQGIGEYLRCLYIAKKRFSHLTIASASRIAMKLFTHAISLNFILFESVKTLTPPPLMSRNSYRTSSEAKKGFQIEK